ncbi:MAG: PH domain-containing protein [Bacteroidia bacterium]|nr:PH domain-containing protein [Bacteroidia bacterium]
MTTDFSNSVILPENLPAIELAEFTPIDRKYLKIIYIQYAIWAMILIFWGIFFFILPKDEFLEYGFWILTGLSVVILCSSLIVSYLSFPRRGYLVREKDIAYQRGLIRYKLTSIPFNRIQHVVLNQGVVAKHFNLASIKIFTAGSSADDLNIPGLPFETASQIREFLTGKISSDD